MPKSNITPLGLDEAAEAMHVAACAKEVAKAIIENGHPEAEDFFSMCGHLYELEMKIPHLEIVRRAEEIDELFLHQGDDDA